IPFTVKVASTDPSETFDITISGIPEGATLYLNGVALDADADGSVTIAGFVNTHELSVKPTEHYSGTFNLEVTASVFDTDVAGNRVQLDTAGHEWAVQTVPVQVIGVADVVTGLVAETDPIKITFSEGELDAAGNSIALKSLVSAPALVDNDGSETLTLRLTGLGEQFQLQGATFLGGEGTDRLWVFTADEWANGSVKIIVPEHFNGEVQAAVHAVTTERDGDSLTGNAVNIKAIVTPTVDSGTTVVAGSSGLIEDTWGKVNFHVRHDSGDRDEYLSKVWIKVSDTQGANFSFGLGEEYVAFAEDQPVQTIDGQAYYVLTAEQFGNLYIRAADNTHHGSDDPLQFDF